jgi:hypothetical protein
VDSLTWLQDWYAKHCDGDWEHSNGVQIDTLDNPGWSVNINPQDTRYNGVLNAVIVEDYVGNSDWIVCRIVDGKFEGRGDSQKLLVIVQKFRSWIDNY